MAPQEIVALKGAFVSAENRWACDVLVNTDIVSSPVRWRTYIHEMLHSVSVGLNEGDFGRFRGWEEGVVEQSQRLLRERVLSQVGAATPEAAFFEGDRMWRLNHYIEALEELRQFLRAERESHYLRLLQTPLNVRLAFVRSLSLEPDFQRLFAYTAGRLR